MVRKTISDARQFTYLMNYGVVYISIGYPTASSIAERAASALTCRTLISHTKGSDRKLFYASTGSARTVLRSSLWDTALRRITSGS